MFHPHVRLVRLHALGHVPVEQRLARTRIPRRVLVLVLVRLPLRTRTRTRGASASTSGVENPRRRGRRIRPSAAPPLSSPSIASSSAKDEGSRQGPPKRPRDPTPPTHPRALCRPPPRPSPRPRRRPRRLGARRIPGGGARLGVPARVIVVFLLLLLVFLFILVTHEKRERAGGARGLSGGPAPGPGVCPRAPGVVGFVGAGFVELGKVGEHGDEAHVAVVVVDDVPPPGGFTPAGFSRGWLSYSRSGFARAMLRRRRRPPFRPFRRLPPGAAIARLSSCGSARRAPP